MTMSTKEALARRDELLAESLALLEKADAYQALHARIEAEEDPHSRGRLPQPKASQRALAAARVDATRGKPGAAAEVQRLEERIADIQQRLPAELDAARLAQEARRAIEADLAALYVDEFAAFARHAEELSREADARLDELREPLVAALEAWNHAEEAWRPLCKHNRLSHVEAFPLPSAEQLAAMTARPADVAPIEEASAA